MSDMTRHCPLCGDFARRAEKAEADLAALRAETADLHEIERCKRSIVEAGVHWEGGSEHRKHFRIYQGEPDKNGCYPWVWWGMDGSASDWQQAERAAWDLAAEPFRARCKAAGWPVLCITPRGNCGPITIEGPAYRIKCFGEPYGYPTLDALEQAAKWAEEHPAGEIRDCSRCLHGQLGGPPPGNPCWNGLNCGFDAKPEPDVKPPATPHPANASSSGTTPRS